MTVTLEKPNIKSSETNYELFYQMAEMSADGYFIYSTINQQFLYMNKALADIFEQERDHLFEKPDLFFETVHPEDRDHAMFCYNECLYAQGEKKYEIRLQFFNSEKYIRVIVYPMLNGGRLDLVGTVEDTTVMRHNKIHIEQINARKNVTLEVLSHDLKEPLAMMKLVASSIESNLKGIDQPDVLDAVAFMKEMCERNILLIKSLINKEFLKSSIIEVGKERTDLVWELRDIIRYFKRSKFRKTKKFIFNTASDVIYLPLDSMKFVQVINNLISNALKFTPENGIITVDAEERVNTVLVSVADNGIGIPEEMQHDLFNRLPQTLRPGLMGEESGGFGLAIVKSIVDLHNGKIWFESKVGVGTTFYIELPK